MQEKQAHLWVNRSNFDKMDKYRTGISTLLRNNVSTKIVVPNRGTSYTFLNTYDTVPHGAYNGYRSARMHGSFYEYQKDVSLALHDRMAKTFFFVVHSGVQLYLWDDIQDNVH